MMTQRERFFATVGGERPERILYTASFCPDLRRRVEARAGTDDLAGHYGLFEPVEVAPRPPPGWTGPDYSVYYRAESLPEGTRLDCDGVARIPSGFYHFEACHSPLRSAQTLEQLESYPIADESYWPTDHMAEQVRSARQGGKVTAGVVGHMYETAWQIRGHEQFLVDMIDQPAWAECMLEKLFVRNLVRAIAAARAGADLLLCGDDVANQNAMMFSPLMWRRFMLSRWSKVWQAARRIKGDIHIWYHSDGNIEPIIADLLAAGVTILNPIQPECMDPARLRKQYPRLNMDGTIGTQFTMPWAKPQEVRQVVAERIGTCGGGGRLILGPTHVLEPEVPIENFEAYVEAARAG